MLELAEISGGTRAQLISWREPGLRGRSDKRYPSFRSLWRRPSGVRIPPPALTTLGRNWVRRRAIHDMHVTDPHLPNVDSSQLAHAHKVSEINWLETLCNSRDSLQENWTDTLRQSIDARNEIAPIETSSDRRRIATAQLYVEFFPLHLVCLAQH